MSLLSFEECRRDFEWDGSWRDIYVLETDVNDWNRVLAALDPYRTKNSPEVLPRLLPATFRDPQQEGRYRQFRFHGIHANCHFFTEDEIEFDIDPREVSDQQSLNSLIELLLTICKASAKATVLTDENLRDAVIFRISPESLSCQYFNRWV